MKWTEQPPEKRRPWGITVWRARDKAKARALAVLCAALTLVFSPPGLGQENPDRRSTMPDAIPSPRPSDAAVKAYPYPPQALWERLMTVVKTSPRDVTYQKIGAIFGLEFDEHKIMFHQLEKEGGDEKHDYMAGTRTALKDGVVFPFPRMTLNQTKRPPKLNGRYLSFSFEIFDPTFEDEQIEPAAKTYCVVPQPADLAALGYPRNDDVEIKELATTSFRPGQRLLHRTHKYLREEVHPDRRRVELKLLPSGCLISFNYDITY